MSNTCSERNSFSMGVLSSLLSSEGQSVQSLIGPEDAFSCFCFSVQVAWTNEGHTVSHSSTTSTVMLEYSCLKLYMRLRLNTGRKNKGRNCFLANCFS